MTADRQPAQAGGLIGEFTAPLLRRPGGISLPGPDRPGEAP